jgi:hypothetical protein
VRTRTLLLPARLACPFRGHGLRALLSWAERALLSGLGAGQPEGGQKDAEPPAVDLARTPATEEKRSERVGEAGAGKVWVECGVWEDGKVGADQSLDVVEEECMVPDLALSLIANCAASVISAVSEERLASTHSISSGVSGVKGLEEREEEDGGGCGEEGSSAGEALEVNRDDDEECENSGGWSGGESSAEEENDELLEVKVEGTDGRMSWFKIRQHTKLTKVFNLFCERFKLERDEATFLFDECEIDGFDTPHDLDLQVPPAV